MFIKVDQMYSASFKWPFKELQFFFLFFFFFSVKEFAIGWLQANYISYDPSDSFCHVQEKVRAPGAFINAAFMASMVLKGPLNRHIQNIVPNPDEDTYDACISIYMCTCIVLWHT